MSGEPLNLREMTTDEIRTEHGAVPIFKNSTQAHTAVTLRAVIEELHGMEEDCIIHPMISMESYCIMRIEELKIQLAELES